MFETKTLRVKRKGVTGKWRKQQTGEKRKKHCPDTGTSYKTCISELKVIHLL
jgi:hypothetical protein